jgi:hypothetical protein
MLDRMRSFIFERLERQPEELDEKTRAAAVEQHLAGYRGLFSPPQLAMLRKAFIRGLTEAGGEALLDRHAKALVAHRVATAAGNAAHSASEAAKLIGWQIAQFFGALPGDARRDWITVGDERVRHDHSRVPTMNPRGVRLEEPFETPFGQVFTPPLEYGCRCRAALRLGR